MKPFKGEIHNWSIRTFVDGYIITGIPVGHPKFKNWMRTSKVVKRVGRNVETLNSRYVLVGEEVKEK